MKLTWHISEDDVARVRALLEAQKDNAIVRKRKRLNLAADKSPVTRDSFWYQMVNAQLTSAQRSGPNSYVGRFVRRDPFPLSYDELRGRRDVEHYCRKVIVRAGGIRFHGNIAERLAANLKKLEDGAWHKTLAQCDRLRDRSTYQTEAEVARYLADEFAGIGPKQSRNLLQGIGLTRYEIPLDSRVTNWLNKAGFPIKINAKSLSEIGYYEFVSEGFRKLCAKADVFPCLLDAAIFAQADGNEWNDDNVLGA